MSTSRARTPTSTTRRSSSRGGGGGGKDDYDDRDRGGSGLRTTPWPQVHTYIFINPFHPTPGVGEGGRTADITRGGSYRPHTQVGNLSGNYNYWWRFNCIVVVIVNLRFFAPLYSSNIQVKMIVGND